MSKSDENANASIYLMDDPDTIIRKFKRAVTDSDNEIRYSDEKPGIRNLLEIYAAATGKSIEAAEKEFSDSGYGEFKLAVGEAVVGLLKPIQDKFAELSKNKDYIDEIIKVNAEKANYYATKTLRKVQKKVGFPERIR
jgi:tryptophanyl-tRNA synthetase